LQRHSRNHIVNVAQDWSSFFMCIRLSY
jgi:hypothetical protein